MNANPLPLAAESASTPRAETTLADTIAVLRRVLVERFGIENPDLSEHSEIASLGLDSLSFIEYVFDLEGELHVTLPDLPRELSMVGDFARYIHAQVLQQSSDHAAP